MDELHGTALYIPVAITNVLLSDICQPEIIQLLQDSLAGQVSGESWSGQQSS